MAAVSRAAGYDLEWLQSLDMGPNPLLQVESLLTDLALQPGQRVLDLGCGRAASSVFLARECGVEVVAFDRWIDGPSVGHMVETFGLTGRIEPVQGDARQLPFLDHQFDAVVSIDAFEYFGTDVHFLSSLLRVVKPGGRIAISTPGLVHDPYQRDPPAAVTDLLGWEAAAWHAPQWWQQHWQLSGLVDHIHARFQPGSHQSWLEWSRAVGGEDDPSTAMLKAVTADHVGLVLVTARRA